jgi:hypothetical protein
MHARIRRQRLFVFQLGKGFETLAHATLIAIEERA